MVMTREGARPRGPAADGTTVRHGRAGRCARGTAAVRARAHWSRVRSALQDTRDAGMATAEYAIATVAAAGFAGLLILILRSDEVRELLTGIVRGALAT